jgi:Fe-S protein assembly co-chaperone HscB
MTNYFTLLELPEQFALADSDLRQHYFALQRKYHPDNAKDNSERLRFIQLSADINAAYNTLKNPHLRLYYLLKLQGVDLLAENNNLNPPAHILLEVMELREEAMEAKDKVAFISKLDTLEESLISQATHMLDAGELNHATNAALRLRYIHKIKEDFVSH